MVHRQLLTCNLTVAVGLTRCNVDLSETSQFPHQTISHFVDELSQFIVGTECNTFYYVLASRCFKKRHQYMLLAFLTLQNYSSRA